MRTTSIGLNAIFKRAQRRIATASTPPIKAIVLGFFVLFFFGLITFTDQLNHYWNVHQQSGRNSILIKIISDKSNIISVSSSTGFFGRWERGSDPLETVLRLEKHINELVFKHQFVISLMKKPDLSPTTVVFKLGKNLHYSDFSPLLTALRGASIDNYSLL